MFLNYDDTKGVTYTQARNINAVVCDCDDIADFLQDCVDNRATCMRVEDESKILFAVSDGSFLSSIERDKFDTLQYIVLDIHNLLTY